MKHKPSRVDSFNELKRIEIENIVNCSLIPEILKNNLELVEQARYVIELARKYKFDDACLLINMIERRLEKK